MERSAEDGWFRIDVNLPVYASDAVSDLLFRLGSCGLEVESGAAGGTTGLKAYFPAGEHSVRVVSGLWSGLVSTFGDLRSVRVEVAEVPPEDWASSWKSPFPARLPGSDGCGLSALGTRRRSGRRVHAGHRAEDGLWNRSPRNDTAGVEDDARRRETGATRSWTWARARGS